MQIARNQTSSASSIVVEKKLSEWLMFFCWNSELANSWKACEASQKNYWTQFPCSVWSLLLLAATVHLGLGFKIVTVGKLLRKNILMFRITW